MGKALHRTHVDRGKLSSSMLETQCVDCICYFLELIFEISGMMTASVYQNYIHTRYNDREKYLKHHENILAIYIWIDFQALASNTAVAWAKTRKILDRHGQSLQVEHVFTYLFARNRIKNSLSHFSTVSEKYSAMPFCFWGKYKYITQWINIQFEWIVLFHLSTLFLG